MKPEEDDQNKRKNEWFVKAVNETYKVFKADH